jgi:hypothetical protein
MILINIKNRFVKLEHIGPKKQQAFRPEHQISFDSLFGSFTDSGSSYLLPPILGAAFGATLHIEGSFPYCPFFSIQVSPSFGAKE